MPSAILQFFSFRIAGSSLSKNNILIKIILANLKLTKAATGGFLKNFARFTGKYWCQSLSFNKVADSGTGIFL